MLTGGVPFSGTFPEHHPWNLQEMLVSSRLACSNSCSRSGQLPLWLCIDSDAGASSGVHRSSSHSPACSVRAKVYDLSKLWQNLIVAARIINIPNGVRIF